MNKVQSERIDSAIHKLLDEEIVGGLQTSPRCNMRVLTKMLQAGRRDVRRNWDYHQFCNKPRCDFRTGEMVTASLRFAAMAAHLIETAHVGGKLDSTLYVY